MTVYEMCDALLKSGIQLERGWLSDLRSEVYANKGDESEITRNDVVKVQRLYKMYFREQTRQTRVVTRAWKRSVS